MARTTHGHALAVGRTSKMYAVKVTNHPDHCLGDRSTTALRVAAAEGSRHIVIDLWMTPEERAKLVEALVKMQQEEGE